MNDKKKPTEEQPRKPVKTFRSGAVGASVWLKQSNTGLIYYDFSLSRSWKSMASGKEGYSSSYFEANRDELKRVVDQCCDYIEQLGRRGVSDFPPRHERVAA